MRLPRRSPTRVGGLPQHCAPCRRIGAWCCYRCGGATTLPRLVDGGVAAGGRLERSPGGRDPDQREAQRRPLRYFRALTLAHERVEHGYTERHRYKISSARHIAKPDARRAHRVCLRYCMRKAVAGRGSQAFVAGIRVVAEVPSSTERQPSVAKPAAPGDKPPRRRVTGVLPLAQGLGSASSPSPLRDRCLPLPRGWASRRPHVQCAHLDEPSGAHGGRWPPARHRPGPPYRARLAGTIGGSRPRTGLDGLSRSMRRVGLRGERASRRSTSGTRRGGAGS